MSKKNIYLLLFFFWFTLIAIVSSIPSLVIPLRYDGLLQPDKLAHFSEYAILCILWHRLRREQKKSYRASLLLATIFSLIIPVIDEWHQLFIPGRSFSYYDMLADFTGFWIVNTYIVFKNLGRQHEDH